MMYDDETLMAFADGELDAGLCREIEAALATDPELARRINAQRRLREQVFDHFQSELEAPIPEGVMALLQPASPDSGGPQSDGHVLPHPATAANDRRPIWANLAAIAASLLIGVLIGGQWPGRDAGEALLRPTPNGLFAAGRLEAALTGHVSGTDDHDGIRVMFSFPAIAGGYCRSFTASGTAGIACRDDAGWQVRATGAMPVSDEGVIRTAGTGLPLALLEEIDRISAGDPLDPSGEAALIDRDWQDGD